MNRKVNLNKNTKRSYFVFAALITIILLVIARQKVHIAYIKLFNKSEVIANYDNYGKLDGEYVSYVNGKIRLLSHFKNGQKEGLCTWYDNSTGKRKREIYYRSGIPAGIENSYYANGNLNYTVEWKDNKYINSQYHYQNTGTLNTYNAFDFSKKEDNGFCYVGYDNNGKFHQMLGNVFSSYIFSMCKDSIIELNKDSEYRCINHIYINVATPPQLITDIEVVVNKVSYIKKNVRHNTLVTTNIFNKTGKYEIIIYGKLKTKTGILIKSDTLTMTLNRQ